MNLLTDFGQLLQSEGVGTLGTDIFLSRAPDQPDECLILTEYQAYPSRIFGNRNIPADERHAVQVMARAADYPSALSLAHEAYDVVNFRHKTLASGRRYAWSKADSQPFFMGVDGNDRKMVVFNIRIRRHRTTDLV